MDVGTVDRDKTETDLPSKHSQGLASAANQRSSFKRISKAAVRLVTRGVASLGAERVVDPTDWMNQRRAKLLD